MPNNYYTHNGDTGYLLSNYELSGGADYIIFVPLDELTEDQKAKITNGKLETKKTYFEYYGSSAEKGDEIVQAKVTNVENDQRTVTEWVLVSEAKEEEHNREYLTITDSYYDWRSKASEYKERMRDCYESIDSISHEEKEEIEEIYQEYVEEAKKTGDYLSLADFILI